MVAFNLASYASVMGCMEEAKECLRYAIDLDKDVHPVALDDEDLKPPWDWMGSLKKVNRAFEVPELFRLPKEVFNLVEVFETVNFPEQSGVSQTSKAAVISGTHGSGWRSSQTTAKDLCFVAQLTLSDLVGAAY
jgi:hypothetical protein